MPAPAVSRPPKRVERRPALARAAAPPKPEPAVSAFARETRKDLGVGQIQRQTAAMLREVRGKLAAQKPVGLIEEAIPVRAGGYETLKRARGRSLSDVMQAVKRPGARAIVFTEIIGAPVALRGPERISAHYV